MKISFGIPIAPDYEKSTLQTLVTSIDYALQTADDYEILICGEYKKNVKSRNDKIRHIPFDETMRTKWITKKKNTIVNEAKFSNLCILHDYYKLGPAWYEGLVRYNCMHEDKWDVLCSQIYTLEDERHSDWLVNQKYMDQLLKTFPELEAELLLAAPTENNGARWVCGLPYKEKDLGHIQYVSGGYILAKTKIFQEIPFDEQYVWGEAAEDIIWSEAVIDAGHKIKFNPYTIVRLQKPGKWRLYRMTDNAIEKLKELYPVQ